MSTLEQDTNAQRVSRGIILFFLFFLALDGEGGERHPGRFTPGKQTHYPLCGLLGGTQSRSGGRGCGKSHPYRDSIPGPSSS
jgi:hypothetical protein